MASGNGAPPPSPIRRLLSRDPRVQEPFRFTQRLAVRIGVLGTVTLVGFAILFLRLWALQVLSGSQYLQAAQNNQLRTIRVEAPRGPILDDRGRVIVSNRAATAIQIWPSNLPKQHRYGELRRLALLVGVPLPEIAAEIRKRRDDPLTPITVKAAAREDLVAYLYEHQNEFPGVELAQVFLRRYPYHALATQALGNVGEVSAEQLARHPRGLRGGDKIGQSGVEAAYDAYLRGAPGTARLRVDSLGRPRSDIVPRNEPRAGYALRLTLDLPLQQAAESALREGVAAAQAKGQWAANGGAIVAMDPRDGSIRALASFPTYDPSVYVGRVDAKKLAAVGLTPKTAKARNYPALNRATAGLYPPGSTFKPVTAIAAMEEHLISAYESLPCLGQITIAKQIFRNWDPYVDAPMTLPTALAASCDTYFYQVGYDFYQLPGDQGQPLQRWARRFGFGRPTGIDVGPDAGGLVPTIAWRHRTYTKKTDPGHWEVDQLWKPGDSVQLAIGQKDLLVTPLQMARFYALVANGGKLVTPHLAEDVEVPGDARSPAVVRRRFAPGAPQQIDVDQDALAIVREGLYDATHLSFGTSTPIFGSFPVAIAGKTGTAEKVVDLPGFRGLRDQSWWCGYGPADDPKLVVCALIENGGHGGDAAAPAALKVFEQYFGVQALQQGTVYSD